MGLAADVFRGRLTVSRMLAGMSGVKQLQGEVSSLGTERRAGTPRRLRRIKIWAVVAVTAVALGVIAGYYNANRETIAELPLYSEGVHVLPDGSVAAVEPGTDAQYIPGSRVLREFEQDAASERIAQEHQDWLAQADVPGAGTPYEELAAEALLDIHVLTGPRLYVDGEVLETAPGASIAAWTDRWRYVWPRDAAFAATALARVDHTQDALEILTFMQDAVQTQDPAQEQGFHARYLPDGSGVPDDRGIQYDGNGWLLWAASEVLSEMDDQAERDEAFDDLFFLIDTAARNIMELAGAPDYLPPPSPDYWEIEEQSLTLGTVASMMAGLEGVVDLYTDRGLSDEAAAAAEHLSGMREAIAEEFGERGYERYAEDNWLRRTFAARDGRDASTAMLLRPFSSDPLVGAEDAWERSIAEMARPAGGLAPGAGWRKDGVSWTPQTSLYALAAAANGHDDQARDLLDWLTEHRTRLGVIPEKVLADGAPAAVAPLVWSSANVVLAVDELAEHGDSQPGVS